MYGRPIGKRLCHAWGASPIYLLGKYYLGVKPLTAGYQTYIIEPNLGGLQWMNGRVPTPDGDIEVSCNATEIKVKSAIGVGKLRFKSGIKPTVNSGSIVEVSKGLYEITIQKGVAYEVKYKLDLQ
jgi:alpha-L-rhamnosidase